MDPRNPGGVIHVLAGLDWIILTFHESIPLDHFLRILLVPSGYD